ncbi:hypothetical protein OF001_U50023 [Pseudomonas sp. OF001]|uniref:hypothetical protein n=1 Tax=Pseudomonas sp. OF001 TaxID=2772300 RepID=UPI00191938E7|nr:hypothetical protein [Pseudomonas sp. OF001]CAD5379206.1 hypothetical protein OF001_U50023 [Pseudomonas sp. OF001]
MARQERCSSIEHPFELPPGLEIRTRQLCEQGVGPLERAQVAIGKARTLLARI